MDLGRTLVIAPHPDDDVIAAGGLMQRAVAEGGTLHVVYVTDGENNPWPQRWMRRKWSIDAADRREWGEMRRGEAHRALIRLGACSAATTFLGLPDGRIAAALRRGDAQLIVALRTITAAFQPTVVISPSSRDLHVDHRAISRAVHLSAADAPIVTYLVHGTPPANRLAGALELTQAERERKRAAIACHRSQLLLSRERFLSHAMPTESFYAAEFDWIAAESIPRERAMSVRRAFHVLFGTHVLPESTREQPAADVQDSPSDVPGLL